MSDKPIVDELDIAPVEDPKSWQDAMVTGSGARRGTRAVSTKKSVKPTPPYQEGKLVEPLMKVYGAFGLGLMPFAPRVSVQIVENAEDCAVAWDEWAKTSPAVRRLLYPLLNVSGGAKVFAAHLPILAAVLVESMQGTTLAYQVEQYLQSMSQMTQQDSDD